MWLKAILGLLASFPRILDLIERTVTQVREWLDELHRKRKLEEEAKAAEIVAAQ